jgi:hypothetical protein
MGLDSRPEASARRAQIMPSSETISVSLPTDGGILQETTNGTETEFVHTCKIDSVHRSSFVITVKIKMSGNIINTVVYVEDAKEACAFKATIQAGPFVHETEKCRLDDVYDEGLYYLPHLTPLPTADEFKDYVRSETNVTISLSDLDDTVPPKTQFVVMNVNFEDVLGAQRLEDDATQLKVVATHNFRNSCVELSVVPNDSFMTAPSVDCRVDSNGMIFFRTGPTYRPVHPKDAKWVEASRRQVYEIIDRFNGNGVTVAEYEKYKLVAINLNDEDSTWGGAGVFYFGDKRVKEAYLKGIREKGVHVMGRVALMHKILFSLVGIGPSPPKRYALINDSWQGAVRVTKDMIVRCAEKAAESAKKSFRDVITSEREPDANKYLGDLVRRITEGYGDRVLYAPVTSRHLRGKPDKTDAYATKKAFHDLLQIASQPVVTDGLRVALSSKFKSFFVDEINAELGEKYATQMADKMGKSARIIAPEGSWPTETRVSADGKILQFDGTNGIYGVYTKSRSKTGLGVFFDGPQWAVARSFAHVIL